MSFSIYSFIMAVLFFNIFVVVLSYLRKKNEFILSFSLLPIFFLIFLIFFRLLVPIEWSSAKIIHSKSIYTSIFDFFRMPVLRTSVKVYEVLLIIWVVGILILTIKYIYSYTKFKEQLSNISVVENNSSILKKLSKLKNVEIIQSEEISSPMIVGIFKAKIYLPNIEFSDEELKYILLHELNHFKHRDILKKLLISLLSIIFWWNPFTYIFARDFNQILEVQCDLRTTLKLKEDSKILYLDSIRKVLKENSNIKINNLTPALAGDGSDFNLKQRFYLVLDYRYKNKRLNLYNIVLCVMSLALLIISYLFIIQPAYYPEEAENYIMGEEFVVEDDFVIKNSDKSYDLYINGRFKKTLDSLNDIDIKDTPVYERREAK